LDNPNIIKLIGITTSSIPCGPLHWIIATELMDGNLYDCYKLPMVKKIDIIKQICSGLSIFHSKNITHNNLCPTNILVS